jgi:hypothetical protein
LNTTGVNTPARVNEQPLDKALSAKIRAQLSQHPVGAKPAIKIAPETIRDLRITSQNGRVVLEGNVGSKAEKDLIEVNAKEVQGVAAIDNRLKVRNERLGSPASSESGKADQSSSRSRDVIDSASPKQGHSADLDDAHPEITPDHK